MVCGPKKGRGQIHPKKGRGHIHPSVDLALSLRRLLSHSPALQVFRVTPHDEAREAYEAAVRRARLIKDAWLEMGEPVVALGSTGQTIAHPLLKALNEAENLADRLRQRVMAKHPGPEPGAVVQARLGISPAAKLRAARRGELA